MDLERDGKPMLIKATLTKAYAADERIVEDENATEAQKALRAAWLKG